MKICLVTAFPPSRQPLTEYSFHIAREIQRHEGVELTILADEVTGDPSAGNGAHGSPSENQKSEAQQAPELPSLHVIRCWKPGSLANPARLLKAIRRLQPDVVWFNLVFSSFGTPQNPFAAFAGLSVPALTRAAGFYTHITLHHIIEHMDFTSAGVRRETIYRMGTDVATRALLKAHSVSVLLSTYRRTLMRKYSAQNILLGTHGTFTKIASPPDFSKRGNPESRILAFGHWGTYKRLETLMAAFPAVLKKVPDARLIIAGGNHPAATGYWESIREAQPAGLPIQFRGYIPQRDVPELFRTSSVLVMPYESSTGSSGPAHQACEHGVPIVCADIADFRCMATDDDMAINFYKKSDTDDLAEKLVAILQSPELQRQMGEHNYEAGMQMTMASVVNNYLRWFALHRCKQTVGSPGTLARPHWLRSWPSRLVGKSSGRSMLDLPLMSGDGEASFEGMEPAQLEEPSTELAYSAPQHKPYPGTKRAESDGYTAKPGLET